MHYFRKLNENYYIYTILIFIFIPLNFIPPLFDGVMFDYSYEIGDITGLELWYKEMSRHAHLLIIYFVYFLTKYTQLSAEIFIDNLTIIFLILFCIEVKKYSKLLFHLENKWCNLAALFTSIFPVWHTLVAFDVNLYLISIYFLFFGYRNFIKKKKISILIGIVFIILSFDLQTNLSFIVGLAIVHLLLNNANNTNFFSAYKLIIIIVICVAYYFIKQLYFPTSGQWVGYHTIRWGDFAENIISIKLIKNILNYSTYLFLYLWIPLIFVLHLLFINKNNFPKIKLIFMQKFSFKCITNYLLLIILSGFAIFPYLLANKSSSILYLSDYYQRHAFLLAPISGMFFSILFRDMAKINCLQNKVNLNFYLIIFIGIHLILLNYGNYRKAESYLFRKNLINELKAFGPIPKGYVQFIGKNFPADLRLYEVNHLLYKAYNIAGWRGSTNSSGIGSTNLSEPYSELLFIESDKRYSIQFISNEYKYECNTYIYLKNDLKKYERLKKFYIFNYEKNYNIDKVIKKC